MDKNDFVEVRENLEHLEHVTRLSNPTLRIVVTVAVVVVTIVTTVAAALAALDAADAGTSERLRQGAEVAAASAQVTKDQQTTIAAGQRDDLTEARFRTQYLRQEAANGDTAVASPLTQMADASASVEKQLQAPDVTPHPAGQAYDNFTQNSLQQPIDKATETAQAYGQAATGWRAKEDALLATLSMLAVALFLLGLALTVSRWFTSGLFVFVGCALLGLAAFRVVTVGIGGVEPSTDQSTEAINAYIDAEVQGQHYNDAVTAMDKDASGTPAQTQDSNQARSYLQNIENDLGTAVRVWPGFADAWGALAGWRETEADQFDSGQQATDARNAAIAAYRGQLAAAPPSAINYNALAYEQLLAHDVSGAQSSIAAALALEPNFDVAIETDAEVHLVSGDAAGATAELQQALQQVCASHGTQYAATWYQAARDDQSVLSDAGYTGADIDSFFTLLKGSQATVMYDLYHNQPGCQPIAEPAHPGAGVTNLSVTPDPTLADTVTISFDYANLPAGTILTVNLYEYGDTWEGPAHADFQVGTPGLPSGSGHASTSTIAYVPTDLTQSTTVEVDAGGDLLADTQFDWTKAAVTPVPF